RWFVKLFSMVLVTTAALLIAFTALVAEVPFHGGRGVARYVVGFHQRPDCPCGGRDIETCVGRQISFDPVRVESCYPAREVRANKLILSLLYTATMLCFGGLIGVLILREEQRARARLASNVAPRDSVET